MRRLLENVTKELQTIGDKGVTTSNLDVVYKLIDIYKDIKESEYYESKTRERYEMRDSRRSSNSYGEWEATGRYGNEYSFGPMERHMNRLEDEMDSYNTNRSRYRDGGSTERVVEGMEMIMKAIHNLIEGLCDYAETSQEKEIIRKHIDKMKLI